MYTIKLRIKPSSMNAWRSLCWWPGLSDYLVTSSISQDWPQKKPPTITAETMARHDEKTSAGRAKMLSCVLLAWINVVVLQLRKLSVSHAGGSICVIQCLYDRLETALWGNHVRRWSEQFTWWKTRRAGPPKLSMGTLTGLSVHLFRICSIVDWVR